MTPAGAPVDLDWQAFRRRYFPESGRHEFDAIVAYGAYRRRDTAAALPPAVLAWESEGGAGSARRVRTTGVAE